MMSALSPIALPIAFKGSYSKQLKTKRRARAAKAKDTYTKNPSNDALKLTKNPGTVLTGKAKKITDAAPTFTLPRAKITNHFSTETSASALLSSMPKFSGKKSPKVLARAEAARNEKAAAKRQRLAKAAATRQAVIDKPQTDAFNAIAEKDEKLGRQIQRLEKQHKTNGVSTHSAKTLARLYTQREQLAEELNALDA